MDRQEQLKRRRKIQIKRVFQAEYIGGGRIKYSCAKCGSVQIKDLRREGLSDAQVQRLVASHHRNPPTAICRLCTRRARDQKYPLA